MRSALDLQEARLRAELRTEFMAEEAIKNLLSREEWELRKFGTIKGLVGGFGDDHLRQLLVRAGALRFEHPEKGEMWGLRTRNSELLS